MKAESMSAEQRLSDAVHAAIPNAWVGVNFTVLLLGTCSLYCSLQACNQINF